MNSTVIDGECASSLSHKGGLRRAKPGEENWPPDDWYELLEIDHSDIDSFAVCFSVFEDPETGLLLEVPNDEDTYYGDAATLAQLFFAEGMGPDEIRSAITNAGHELHALLIAKTSLPEVALPGPDQPISVSAQRLGRLLAKRCTHFNRGGVVIRLSRDKAGKPKICEVESCEARSGFEKVATLVRVTESQFDGPVTRPAICNDSQAKAILACEDFLAVLPALRLITNCPVLVEREGELLAVSGYDRQSGILADGEPAEDVGLHEASDLLSEMLSDFKFVTPSDRSRALAACITPALLMGGLLPGRAALDLGEADESQSGKGYRHKLTAAIYGESVQAIATSGRGVGSLEETFDTALVAGRTFISIDNIRGRVDSPKLESFLTEDVYYARPAYTRTTAIDPRRISVMLTSNKAEVTPDLANRSSCVRIEKQPDGFEYRKYPEGDIVEHVRANQPRYLGAVFAIVRAWHAAGKPSTNDRRHDFRAWAGVLDWIVQNLFGAAPLLDGHRETQKRMTSPALNWLRDVALEVTRKGRASEWLAAAALLEMIDAADLEVPGLRPGANLEDETTSRTCLQQIGKRLSRCFGEEDELILDSLGMVREAYQDDQGRDRFRYMVYRNGEAPDFVPF